MNMEHRVMLLDALMQMRRDHQAGRIGMYIGKADAHVLAGFVAGYRSCLVDNGAGDAEATEFSKWLSFEKEEFPPEGWATKYLRDCNGDHVAAITKFLDFVAEFRARRER
ncbi:hypothetical protein F0U62_21785 [Cystobacter fuscus]|uniref:hypothetical protein n=1 Tax=Cystobacter fuscus TaxID=43 RepID=UPI002B3253BC|nr:hypothetical protein F0U62_21785 [Cystobacter fuscus]